MPADAQGIRHDSQRRVDRGARRKEATVHYIKIIEVVSFAVSIENRGRRIIAESDGTVLMGDTGKRDLLAEIQIARNQSLMALTAVDVALSLVSHHLFELLLQTLVRLDVVRRVRHYDIAVLIECD